MYSSVVYSGISIGWWIFGDNLAFYPINNMFAVSPITLCGFTLNVQTICDNHVITAVIYNPIFILLVFFISSDQIYSVFNPFRGIEEALY